MSEERIGILIEAINKTQPQFLEIKDSLQELEYYRMRASRLAFTEQRSVSYLVAAYRQNYSAVYDTVGVLRTVGSIGGQLLSMWNSTNLAQLRVAQSIENVSDAQDYLNEMMYLFGTDSAQYEDALDRLDTAHDSLAAAEDSVRDGNIAMILQMVGVVGTITSFALNIGELALKYESVAAALTIISTIGSIAIPITVTLVGYAAAVTAIEYLQTTAQVAAGETAPGGTQPDFPAGYIEGEYLDIGETTGFNPIPAEIPFDPTAEDWQGGLMRPPGHEGGFGVPRPDAVGSTVIINIDTVETEADEERIADKVIRTIEDYRRSIL